MKIKYIEIHNFRGIKSLESTIEDDIICLIGAGDTCKSTILDSLAIVFSNRWNTDFNDSDFYNQEIDQPILIRVTIGDLQDDLLSESKYGHYLRGWDNKNKSIVDEPNDDLEDVITIQLFVDKNLDPQWTVYAERITEPRILSATQRDEFKVKLIGNFVDREFTWNRGTSLNRHFNIEVNQIKQLGNELIRNAAQKATTQNDDDTSKIIADIQGIAENYAIPLESLCMNLDAKLFSPISGSLSLFDSQIPFRQKGLGSKKLLSFAIQKHGCGDNGILLCDEVELGLEPNRICRLINNMKSGLKGQIILSTHSPVVLRELSCKQLWYVENSKGIININRLTDTLSPDDVNLLQANVRKNAESFLSKKLIVCEGATEVGFLRGLDNFWTQQGNKPCAFYGVSFFDGGGSISAIRLSTRLCHIGYNVAVFGDSDTTEIISAKGTLESQGISIFVWPGNTHIEGRLFSDLPPAGIIELMAYIIENKSIDHVKSKYASEYNVLPADLLVHPENYRANLSQLAHKNDWFKRIDHGVKIAEILCRHISNINDTPLFTTCQTLLKWIEKCVK